VPAQRPASLAAVHHQDPALRIDHREPSALNSTRIPTCPEKEWQGTSSSLKEEA